MDHHITLFQMVYLYVGLEINKFFDLFVFFHYIALQRSKVKEYKITVNKKDINAHSSV